MHSSVEITETYKDFQIIFPTVVSTAIQLSTTVYPLFGINERKIIITSGITTSNNASVTKGNMRYIFFSKPSFNDIFFTN
jgi:hypothetical protein